MVPNSGNQLVPITGNPAGPVRGNHAWNEVNVSEDEALDWRDEAWAEAEGEEEKEGDEHVEGSDANPPWCSIARQGGSAAI